MRVLLVIGTRPEAVKCFPVVEALRKHTALEVVICVTGQHREILYQTMDLVGLEADFDLEVMRALPTLTDITCDVLQGIANVLRKVQPSRVLVQGDTTTTMAAALSAFYHHIPVGHIEAGLRTGDMLAPWPEEANRRIVSLVSDLHFAPTEAAAANLIAENVPLERIHVTGNTAIDALLATRDRLEVTRYTSPSIKPVISELDTVGKKLILITAHRRENWGDGIRQICRAALRLASRGDVQIAIPVHPNPNVREPLCQALSGHRGISLLEPLDYLSFVDLMRRCQIVLTDSGGLQEEAPALGKPVLVLRETTERPEGVEAGAARLVGLDCDRIVNAVERLLENEVEYRSMSQACNPFGDGKAAVRIAQIIAGTAQPICPAVAHAQSNTAPETRSTAIASLS